MKRLMSPSLRSTEADGLTDSMNARISPSGSVGYRSAAEDAFQNSLEFGLYRAAGWLALPPEEAGAVVVKRGEKGPAHRGEM